MYVGYIVSSTYCAVLSVNMFLHVCRLHSVFYILCRSACQYVSAHFSVLLHFVQLFEILLCSIVRYVGVEQISTNL